MEADLTERTIIKLKQKEVVEILTERDGLKCQIYFCKDPYTFTDKNFVTIDHIKPRSKGGTDDLENLCLAHFKCNNLKGDREYLEDGTLEPLPYKEPKSAVEKRPPCETCNEGRDLKEDDECPTCGLGPMPAKFPNWAKLQPKDCPHSGIWHCWACTIGVYERVPAVGDVFGEE